MITLSNLAEASLQDIFNQVATHLLTQGKRSESGNCDQNTCLYVHGNLKCAAGCLIADDEYDTDMEGDSVRSVVLRFNNSKDLPRPAERALGLIQDLQQMHDKSEPGYWREELAALALNYGLEMEP